MQQTTSKLDKNKRILFRLEQDADGYPPNNWESLWAREITESQFQIDNIPFFVRGISLGDIVTAENSDGELRFKHLVSRSGNSVIRVIVFDIEEVTELRNELRKLGCASEQSHIEGLFAISIPSSVQIGSVDELLRSGEAQGKWEYEDASIRHNS